MNLLQRFFLIYCLIVSMIILFPYSLAVCNHTLIVSQIPPVIKAVFYRIIKIFTWYNTVKPFLCLVLQQPDFRKCFMIFTFIWFGFSISIVRGNILWLVMVREDPLVSVNDSRNLFGTVCSKPISEQLLACLGLAWQAVKEIPVHR